MKKILIICLILGFLLLFASFSEVSATTLSDQIYNAILLNSPVIYGNEYYGIDANYINGYGMWNS